MRKQSYKTFLMNEANRLSGLDTRSIVKLIETDNPRVKSHVVCLMLENDSFYLSSSKQNVKTVSEEALKIKMGIDSIYSKDVIKFKGLYKNYLERIEWKTELMDKLSNDKMLYSVCKQQGKNYGNAFNFFVNKKVSSLTEKAALEIIMEAKQRNK